MNKYLEELNNKKKYFQDNIINARKNIFTILVIQKKNI